MKVVVLTTFLLVAATVSRAQSVCDTSYSAFTAMTSCSDAVMAVIQFINFPATDDLATACSTECEALWRTALADCGPDVSMDIAPISLVCAAGPGDQSCYQTLTNIGLDNITRDYVALMIPTCVSGYSAGNCTPECQQFIMNIQTTLGCCWAEFIDVLDDLVIGSQQILETWIISSLPALCGIDSSFCDGRPLPEPTPCANAFTALYNNSGCADAASTFISSNYTYGYDEIGQGMCPALLQAFGNSCLGLDTETFTTIEVFGNVLNQFNQASQCSTSSIGDLTSIYFSPDVDRCIQDFVIGRCSADCRMTIENLVDDYGCCANEFARGFYGPGTIEQDSNIVYVILTREIYTLCDIQSPGFCLPTDPVYTDSALQCVNTTNAFYAVDDFCTNNYRELYRASSIASITNAAARVCINGQCINRFIGFAEYLSACRDLETGDDTTIGEDLGFLSTLLERTACSTNGSDSCAAVTLFSSTLPTVYSAFDEGGACNMSLTANRCSDECRQVIMLGTAETGCCFRQFVIAFLAENGYNQLQSICGLSIPRCDGLNSVISNECLMTQEAILDGNNCAVPFTNVMNVATGTVSGVTLNQLDQDLKTVCNNENCRLAVTTYLDRCADTETGIAEFRNGFTCETSEQSINCYALSLSEHTVLALTSAFDASGNCEPLLQTSGDCSAPCKSLFMEAMQNVGQCLTDIVSTILMNREVSSGVRAEDVLRRCEISNPSGNGGAESVVKGFGTFVTLLLAVIALLL